MESPRVLRGSNLLLPVGIDRYGHWRYPSEVEQGKACGCFCPKCGDPLIARHGEILQWHFAHDRSANEHPNGYGNESCREGVLHIWSKHLVKKSIGKCIVLPKGKSKYKLRIDSAQEEVVLPKTGRRVDLLLTVGIVPATSPIEAKPNCRKHLVVEICVTNPKDEAYSLDMLQEDISAVEINVTWKRVHEHHGNLKNPGARTESALKSLLLSMTCDGVKRWLHHKDMRICRYCNHYVFPAREDICPDCGYIAIICP